jgi:hypothetical protein
MSDRLTISRDDRQSALPTDAATPEPMSPERTAAISAVDALKYGIVIAAGLLIGALLGLVAALATGLISLC